MNLLLNRKVMLTGGTLLTMERLVHGNSSSTTRPEFSEIVQSEALSLPL